MDNIKFQSQAAKIDFGHIPTVESYLDEMRRYKDQDLPGGEAVNYALTLFGRKVFTRKGPVLASNPSGRLVISSTTSVFEHLTLRELNDFVDEAVEAVFERPGKMLYLKRKARCNGHPNADGTHTITLTQEYYNV